MKRSEIKGLTVDEIITNIFYYGVAMCNDCGTKKMEKELAWHCDELEKRGIVKDGSYLHERMSQ